MKRKHDEIDASSSAAPTDGVSKRTRKLNIDDTSMLSPAITSTAFSVARTSSTIVKAVTAETLSIKL